MTPHIIFEDSDILVLDKPAGWIVNKADTTKGEKTIQEWIEEYIGVSKVSQVSKVLGALDSHDTFLNRGGIVHRLDKETSGILVVAKNPAAFENLKNQFKDRRVKKVYTALCHGKVQPETGEIRVPVGRLPWNRMRFGVIAEGRDSITKYKVLSIKYLKKEPLTLLELFPETGRTHQIRVHLKHINHPIFADALYAGRKTSRDDRKIISRMFLHASKLTLYHPTTGKELVFESPLPKELQEFLSRLQSKPHELSN